MDAKPRSRKYLFLAIFLSASLLLTTAASTVLMAQKISGHQVLNGDVYDYDITTTSSYTVFMSDPVTDHVMELYSVPTWGGNRTLLSPGMTEMRGVLGFRLSPDGTKVVYWVGFGEEEERAEAIYVVPVAGGTPINLTGQIVAGLYLEGEPGIAISADSQWLFFTLGDLAAEHVLYRVPLSGIADPEPISPTDEDCLEVKFAPMPSDHGVVYARTKLGLVGSELVYVNPSGVSLTLTTISGVFGEGGITPDGQWVLYIEDLYGVSGDDLFAVSLDGLTKNQLNDPLVMGGDVVDFQISTDNSAVVYRADQDVNDVFEIYTVEFEHGWVYDLIPSMVAGGDVIDYELIYYENKAIGVAYRADQLVDEKIDLGSVSMNGATSYLLNPGMPNTGDVTDFKVSTNGIAVVFIADYIDDQRIIWINTVIGDNLNPIGWQTEDGTPLWPTYSDVEEFSLAPNDSFIAFIANLDQQFVDDLYIVQYTDLFTRKKISGPMENPRHVDSFLITPNSQGVVYRADQDTDHVWELYSVFYRFVQYMPVIAR